MSDDVVVPKWGLTADDMVLVGWLCEIGDEVAEAQPLANLETDKASGELESPIAGIVEELLAQPGDEVQPGQVVLRIRWL